MDWKKLTQDLLEAGISQADIARELGIKPPSVSDIGNGITKDVRWSTGNKLIALHKRVMAANKKAA